MEPKLIGEIVRNARELKGLSQEEVAEIVGGGQSTIGRIENGDFKRLPSALPALVELLGIKPEDIELMGTSLVPSLAVKRAASGLPPVGDPYGPRDFAIYSAAEGGPGEVIRSADPVDWWPRPIEVAQVKGAYGIYIVGDSMAPEFEPGHVAVINPHLPLVAGKPYIFYAEMPDGSARATVKRLRSHTHDCWRLTQHNPPNGQEGDFELPRDPWRWAHRIVGRQDPA